MNIKSDYLQALKKYNGSLNELEVGAMLNYDDETTQRVISMLLSEHRIEYARDGLCNYRVMKKKTHQSI